MKDVMLRRNAPDIRADRLRDAAHTVARGAVALGILAILWACAHIAADLAAASIVCVQAGC